MMVVQWVCYANIRVTDFLATRGLNVGNRGWLVDDFAFQRFEVCGSFDILGSNTMEQAFPLFHLLPVTGDVFPSGPIFFLSFAIY